MPLQQIQVIDFRLLGDSAGKEIIYDRKNIIDTTTGTFSSTFPVPDEGRSEKIEVPDAAVAQVIPFNNIAEVRTLYIQTDRQITLNFTDAVTGANSITIAGSAAELGVFLVNGRLAAATVDNSSGGTATVTTVISGT